MAPLTDLERSVLIFSARPSWTLSDIRVTFGFSPARFHQLLSSAIDKPDAAAEFPMLVHRRRRMRDKATRARAERRFA